MKQTFGAIAFAAVLVLAGVIASTPAAAASNNEANASNGVEANYAASTTDVSARHRHGRRYRVARPWPHRKPYSYGYYRPRPIFYRPFLAPAPLFSVGFGPRYHW